MLGVERSRGLHSHSIVTNWVGSTWATLGAGGALESQHQGGPWQEVAGEPGPRDRQDLPRQRGVFFWERRREGRAPSCYFLPGACTGIAHEGQVGDSRPQAGDPPEVSSAPAAPAGGGSLPYQDRHAVALQPQRPRAPPLPAAPSGQRAEDREDGRWLKYRQRPWDELCPEQR